MNIIDIHFVAWREESEFLHHLSESVHLFARHAENDVALTDAGTLGGAVAIDLDDIESLNLASSRLTSHISINLSNLHS